MKMFTSASALAATAFIAAATSPATAAPGDLSDKETRSLMHAYAGCVVDRRAAKASEALLKNVDNSAILRQYPMLVIGDCLAREARASATMSFSGDLYRYALADALVNKELATQDLPDLSAVPRLAHLEPGEEPGATTATGKKLSKRKLEEALKDHRERVAVAFLSKYGECVVRIDPRGSKFLLHAAPDSEDESKRITALRPALARCMPEGSTVSFSRTTLRGSIAINYYRLAHAARVASTKAAS
jgi:hypothetical protein